MRFVDIFNSEECQEIFSGVNKYVSDCLKGYNDRIESLGFNAKPKDIFDVVWGSVELNEVEICLIDSPLIQRLRHIQQLGFASYVYCNADYSRLSHTIGVVEVAGRVANVVTSNLKQGYKNNDIFNMFEIVRLGAIFHDAGHLFYSHVSEKFFTENRNYKHMDKITAALSFFCEKISIRASLHEMFSVMIVNSDEVSRFFNLTAKHLGRSKILYDEHTRLLIDYISGLIVGTAIDRSILPYSAIIKGAIDADRMDYLSRDSMVTKVPLAVDIARLIKKITVVSIEYEPSQVWNDYSPEAIPYLGIAIQYSAKRLIWQLSMARAILYQSIYYHHKKLTAETMFRKACEDIFSLIPEKSFDFHYIFSLKDQAISEYFQEIIIPPNHHEDQKLQNVRSILLRIRDRDLYKRVASFSHDVLDAPNYIYEAFVNNIIEDPFSDLHKAFIEDLTNEYYAVLDVLKKNRDTKAPVFMFIEADWKNEIVDDIPIDYGDAQPKMSSQVFKETPTLGEENLQKQYYLVTDQPERVYVYIALEHMLLKNHGMRLIESSAMCAKFTSEQLSKTKNFLFEKDYYLNSLRLLSDNILRNLYDKNKFQYIVNKYQSYTGVRNTKVTNQSLIEYLKQYLYVACSKNELSLLVDGILRLLWNAIYIDRDYFSKNVSSLLKRILDKGFTKNCIVKLGGMFDSANHLAYYFNDIKEKKEFSFIETVPDALKVADSPESCVIFFDDGAYSGSQVISIFQELMGVPIEERKTNEVHTQELDENSKKLIKGARIILAYLCFNKANTEFILAELRELGICNVDIVFEMDLSNKIFDSYAKVFQSQEQCDVVKAKLTEIGYQVQKSSKLMEDKTYKERWDEERVSEAALGYNDAQQIVVFESNIPTYTLTPLWQNGEYNGLEWKGLFQRTEK